MLYLDSSPSKMDAIGHMGTTLLWEAVFITICQSYINFFPQAIYSQDSKATCYQIGMWQLLSFRLFLKPSFPNSKVSWAAFEILNDRLGFNFVVVVVHLKKWACAAPINVQSFATWVLHLRTPFTPTGVGRKHRAGEINAFCISQRW